MSDKSFLQKLERVTQIQDLIASGQTNITEIAKKFNITWVTAKREIKLGNILFNYQLSPENLAKRRKKVNNKLMKIAEEARLNCVDLLEKGSYKEAAEFFKVYAGIWSNALPNIWGLNDSGFGKANVQNITVDQINLNKIDMSVNPERGKEMGDKLFDIAEKEGLKIR